MTGLRRSLLRILALMRKELLVILKDPRSRAVLLAPPVVQCLVFGYAATYDLNQVTYALVDQDRSVVSREFVSRFDGSGTFERVATVNRVEDAAPLLLAGDVVLVVAIGPGFMRDIAAGGQGAVQVIADGRNSNTAGIAQGYVAAIATAFGADVQRLLGRSGAAVQVVSRAWYNPSLETRWHMIPSLIGAITMLMTMMLAAMSVAREREEGTFDQLLVAPFRPTEIMIGKAVPSMLVGLVQASLILLVALLWFRIPFAGSYLVLYTGLMLFLAAAIGIGLFLSSLAKNMQQAMILTFLLLMPFMLLSGLMAPTENMPAALRWFTMVNPLNYAITITRRVYLEGAGYDVLLPDMLALGAIAAVTLPVAAWFFRNRLA